jgi:hypothetical protein
VTVRQDSLSSPEKYGETGRTVDTPASAETLSAWYECRAVSERCARAAGMYTYGARTRRKVRQESRGLPVRGVVIRRWARLEYEDAQVRVCRRKTPCDDTTSSATYRTSSVRKSRALAREGGDGAPPAMMISYSSLIWVGVDIISWQLDGVKKQLLGVKEFASPSNAPYIQEEMTPMIDGGQSVDRRSLLPVMLHVALVIGPAERPVSPLIRMCDILRTSINPHFELR